MASAIEDIIDDLEEYIDGCKPALMSSSKILVNRDEIEGLLEELRAKTPEEIRRYQKIISNKEAILADAQRKADAIIAEAQITKNELVSEHQIMQQAYAQANEVVMIATKQAQEILDNATNDANGIRSGAIAYTDELLRSVQDIVKGSIDTTRARDEAFLSTMQGYLDVITANRSELAPEAPAAKESTQPQAAPEKSEPVSQTKPESKPADKPEVKSGLKKEITPKTEPAKDKAEEVSVSPEQTVLNIPEEFFNKKD